MSIKITGMNSGLDTDAIIKELVSAQSEKKTKLEKEQTKLEWKQTAWTDLNKKIKSFYSSALSNFRFSGSYKKKKTTSSNDSVATVTAGDSAVNGSQSLVVKQLAKSGYLTGGKLSNNKSVSGSTTLSALTGGKIAADDSASFSVKVKGKETTIDLKGTSSVQDVISQLNKAGVNASFDADNQRIFVSVSESGAANDFELNANNVNGLQALSGLGLLTKEEMNRYANQNSELAALYDGTDLNTTAAKSYITEKATAFASSLQSQTASPEKVQSYYDAITKLNEDWDASENKTAYEKALADYGTKEVVEENQKILDEKKEYLELLEKKNALGEGESLSAEDAEKLADYENKYNTPPTFTKEDLDAEQEELNAAGKAFDAYDTYQNSVKEQENAIKSAAKNAKILNDYYAEAYTDQLKGVTGDTYTEKLDSVNARITEKTANGEDTSELESLQKLLTTMSGNEQIYSGTGVTADDITYDASTTGILNRAETAVTQEAAAAYEAVHHASDYLTGINNAVRVVGQDAVIELNGAEFTSANNSFAINGLTITAKTVSNVVGKDENDNPIYEATQLNTEDDVDGIYDMIRNFFKEYNDLIKEIDTLYGAESAKDYEPLTSEEKDAMTDDEIEKWEKKIKDSLLRRDSNLGDIRSTLKTAMQASFTIGGKNYSLASFGISTQGYFDAADGEKSLLHIDGDSADTVSSGNTDKLKQMIATNPDTVSSFFTKLATNLYDSMQKMSRSSGNRTFGNFYDDKVLNSQYDDYKSKISKQEEKLNNLEDKYYKMFSSMETQLSKINSTSNYISSMLGS